jgi:DamX protein
MPASGSDQLGIGDKLAFLACYSRYNLSITAENHGQLSQLLSQELEGAAPVSRLGVDEVRKYDLPILIASGFGLREASPGSRVVLESLDTMIKNSVVRPLVTVDDAHLLSEAKLRQLLILSERIGFGLALFGRKSLERRKACAQFESRIFHTTVPKLAESDVRHLVRRRAQTESHFSDMDIDQLIERSDGQMDKLDGLIDDMIESPHRRLGLPLVHMSALIVLAVVIVGGWMSMDSGETIATEAVSLPGTLLSSQQTTLQTTLHTTPHAIPQSLVPQNVRLLDGAGSDIRSQLPERDLLVEVDLVEVDLLALEGVPVDEVPAVVVNPPTVIPSADPNAWVNELPPSAAGSVSKSGVSQSSWLRDAPATAYTLQLMGSHSEARVLSFIAEQRSRGEFGYFKTRHRNQPWFVLTLGQYGSRDRALQAIELLPPSLRAQKPWARSVASIRGS